jgi:predicted  nucleic acid-binding Zn-ribbon protein
MHSDVKAAIRLQEVDSQAAELSKEVSALPKHIAQIETRLAGHQRRVEMDKAALVANGKERKRLEEQIQINNQKVSKLRDQMLAAKNNDQYKAFQNEIEFCESDVRKHEDRILELMGESEPLDRNVKAAEKALAEEKVQVEREKAMARERTSADEKTLAELHAQRTLIATEISRDVLKEYERLRKARRGIAVAGVTDGRCTACHIGVRPQFMQELRRGDTVKYCESCGRILVYHPPVIVEELVGQRSSEA